MGVDVSGASGTQGGPTPELTPGWYPDPTGQADERRWDGTSWTRDTRSASAHAADPPTSGGPAAAEAALEAGWYADPLGEGDERWWDGHAWGAAVRTSPQHETSAAAAAAWPAPEPWDAGEPDLSDDAPVETGGGGGKRWTVLALALLLITTAGVTAWFLLGGEDPPGSDVTDGTEVAGGTAGGEDPTDLPTWGVAVDVPDGAFSDGSALVLAEAADPGGSPLTGSVVRSPTFALEAGGEQPAQPVTVTLPLDAAEVDVPDRVFLARWDEQLRVWVPIGTRYDPGQQRFEAPVAHLSRFSFFEWQAWSAPDGSSREADQVAAAHDLAIARTDAFVQRAADGAAALARSEEDWLAIGGDGAPRCDDPAADVVLTVTARGGEALFVCTRQGSGDEVVLRLANNRPFGMRLAQPQAVAPTLLSWPDLDGETEAATIGSFHAQLGDVLGDERPYVPPGGTLELALTPPSDAATSVSFDASPARFGFDLGALLLATTTDALGPLAREDLGCLSVGGEPHAADDTVVTSERLDVALRSVVPCLRGGGADLEADVLTVARARLASEPRLLSTLDALDDRALPVAEGEATLEPEVRTVAVSASLIAANSGPWGPERPFGDQPANGSGCTPGTDTLPDGTWFGFVDGVNGDRMVVDLACMYTGVRAEQVDGYVDATPYHVVNDNPALRSVPLAPGATFFLHDDASRIDPAARRGWDVEEMWRHLADRPGGQGGWRDGTAAVWILVEGGRLVEAMEFWYGF
jgi:hypothetical protein